MTIECDLLDVTDIIVIRAREQAKLKSNLGSRAAAKEFMRPGCAPGISKDYSWLLK